MNDETQPQTPLEPPQEPPAPEPDQEPQVPTTRVTKPHETKGTYMVLVAPKPGRGQSKRPSYQEVGFYQASGPDSAKRAAVADQEWLRGLLERGKYLLRAVPAQSWPHDVEPSGHEMRPQLVIR